MTARRFLPALVAIAVLAAPGVGQSHDETSHSLRFDSFHQRVGCGVQLKQLGGMSCFSSALPSTELDGYVELHATGEAKIGERGDSPWRGGSKLTHLRLGDHWSRAGVTCTREQRLRCENRDGHGFTLSAKAYSLF